jgi:NADH dehydrogenase
MSVVKPPAGKKRILILGGGFAGAYAALRLEKRLAGVPDVEVVLASRENFILFTPMLHDVAGSNVNVTDIVQPLRKMLRRTQVLIVCVEGIDLTKKLVHVRHENSGRTFDVAYDQLVLALGSVTNFYRIPGLEEHALTMKTLGDAIIVRNRAIDALEIADNMRDESLRRTVLTVVVAGGGFAGVETVGAVNDLLRESLRFYPNLDKDMLRLLVVDPGEVLLPELGASLGRYAEKQLVKRGVEVRLRTKVTGYDGKEVTLGDGAKIPTFMLVWTAGTTPPALLSALPCALQRGRVVTDDCLQVPNWPGVWAVGDCALIPDVLNPGTFYPPTAQHATRQAHVVADNIVAAMHGRPLKPFKFKILGLLATIGRRTGVAEVFGLHFSGFVAFWIWRGIYLMKLPGFQKKVRIVIDWALDFLFWKDLVQLPTLRSVTMSETEKSSEARSA